MELRRSLGFLCATLILDAFSTTMLEEDLPGDTGNRDLSKAILEMLHIRKLSVPHQAKPHPYMMQIYQLLTTQESRHRSDGDGTLVQSFRSIQGAKHKTPGWIWFNVSHLRSSMTVAELVLLRKTQHPEPLSVTVAVHGLSPGTGDTGTSDPLSERLLSLDELPPSGYDVFDVTAALKTRRSGALAFQLRFGDEGGSLVLHEALTRSLYCLHGSSISQPLLVAYRDRPTEVVPGPSSERRQRPHCGVAAQHEEQRTRSRRQRRTAGTACALHERHVNVRDSELGRWLLQPVGFNVSFCRGLCITEESEVSVEIQKLHKKHTENHTLKRSLCSPEKEGPLMVMYRGTSDDIIIKELKNLRAESCACSYKTIIKPERND